ncbi:uncharacterized protein LOC144916285 [Branchiostoma floridae x Branchiostoma belcheri]
MITPGYERHLHLRRNSDQYGDCRGWSHGFVVVPIPFYMSTRTTLHEATDNTRYAYDINLSRNIPCAEVVTDSTMQEEALQLDSWAATNNIIMNGDKSYELRICFARNPPKPPLLILGKTEVPVVCCAT